MVAVVYDRPMDGLEAREHWQPAEIRGASLLLRRPRSDDLPAVIRWYADPEIAALTRYQTRPMRAADIERFFEHRLLAPDALAYSIVELPGQRLIGFTTFSALDADNGSVMFHITIGERTAWNRGLGTQATSLMLGHAFERLGLHRVGLTVFSFNERAIRAYRKAGFRVEGRLRESVQRDGRWFDEVQMGILAEEWLAQRAAEHAPVSAQVAALS
jgi:RimJ/RimL family protein N-acetyltransferase